MRRNVAFVFTALALAASVSGAGAVKVGMGGGTGQGTGGQLAIGALDLFAEMNSEAWLSARLSLCYLPSLLPAEAPAMLLGVGARIAFGEFFRPFFALSGGALIEPPRFGGPVASLAWGVTVGAEAWVTPSFGFYIAGSVTLVQRWQPDGVTTYPYFPWAIGVVVSSPTLRAPKSLPLGVEE